ncbi:bifunctional metallophosphatase/5'-nucleotidase [Brevibacterium litoralis]|uniref:bifunctional metallophosphatase/5'-nucleotidase n=1 Tax=Brevibacterium litoralis TaxID=3138935 RepID=UPI0032ED80B3
MMRLRIPAALLAAAVITLPATSGALAQPTPAPEAPSPTDSLSLSVLATTDVHGHALNWDYFSDAPYPAGEELGLSRAKTVVDGIRAERGEESVLLFDNGDFIQGSPLTSYYSATSPVTETGEDHPMALAGDLMGYDAQVVGNHEYNYGLDMLDHYTAAVDYPVLAANALDVDTGEPYSQPTAMIERTVEGQTVQIGVLGLTTPGSRIWDKQHLEGEVEFIDPVVAAQEYVPQLEAAGADLVVALSHTGKDPESQTWDPAALYENVATSIATEVPGIDLVIAGHTHRDEPEEIVTRADGSQALITQPNYWSRSVSEVDLTLVPDPVADGEYTVDWTDSVPSVVPHYLQGDVAEDPEMIDTLDTHHAATVDYVNQRIGTATETMSGATSRYEDTAIMDFVGMVMTENVQAGIADTEYANLPVLAQTSPFSRDAVFPQGDVTVRDMAGLYIYDNTLSGVTMTGAQLRDYLEFSARYFQQVEEGADFDPTAVTNAYIEADGREIPDYNYDAITGVDYDINISRPVGERIENLRHADGTPVAEDDEFVLAINNYRQSGGGGFPVEDLEEVYNELLPIRESIIDWTVENEVIDPADFFVENWVLTAETLDRTDEGTTPEPTTEPTADVPTESPATEAPSAEPTTAPSETATPTDDTGDGSGSTDTASGDDTGALPRTGVEIAAYVGLGLLLAAAGTGAVVMSRRRG